MCLYFKRQRAEVTQIRMYNYELKITPMAGRLRDLSSIHCSRNLKNNGPMGMGWMITH